MGLEKMQKYADVAAPLVFHDGRIYDVEPPSIERAQNLEFWGACVFGVQKRGAEDYIEFIVQVPWDALQQLEEVEEPTVLKLARNEIRNWLFNNRQKIGYSSCTKRRRIVLTCQ